MARRDRNQQRRTVDAAMDEEIAEQRDGVLRRAAGLRIAVVGAHQQDVLAVEIESVR